MTILNGINRREFVTLSAGVAAASLLSQSMRAVSISQSDIVSLQITGDAQRGYGVLIAHNGQAIARHQGGEFSAIFQNSERSLEDRIDNWKASACSKDGARINLTGKISLSNLRATVFAVVSYEVLPSQVIKKTIQLRQEDMFNLLYQVTNRLEPAAPPAKLWSFDQANCKGGALHEYFPAAIVISGAASFAAMAFRSSPRPPSFQILTFTIFPWLRRRYCMELSFSRLSVRPRFNCLAWIHVHQSTFLLYRVGENTASSRLSSKATSPRSLQNPRRITF